MDGLLQSIGFHCRSDKLQIVGQPKNTANSWTPGIKEVSQDKILWQKLQQSNVWLQAQRIWQQRNPTRTLKGGPWMIKVAKCRCMKKSRFGQV